MLKQFPVQLWGSDIAAPPPEPAGNHIWAAAPPWRRISQGVEQTGWTGVPLSPAPFVLAEAGVYPPFSRAQGFRFPGVANLDQLLTPDQYNDDTAPYVAVLHLRTTDNTSLAPHALWQDSGSVQYRYLHRGTNTYYIWRPVNAGVSHVIGCSYIPDSGPAEVVFSHAPFLGIFYALGGTSSLRHHSVPVFGISAPSPISVIYGHLASPASGSHHLVLSV